MLDFFLRSLNKKTTFINFFTPLFLISNDKLDKYFNRLDSNSNGSISKKEYYENSLKTFNRFDKDDNKIVDKKEAESTFLAKRRPKVIKLWFYRFDKNDNDVVSLKEFKKTLYNNFIKFDRNNDKKIQRKEFLQK